MKIPRQFILAAFVTAGLFFAHAPAALAQDRSKIVSETDTGTVININVGDIIQFSLDENIPNTTPWVSPIVTWTDVAESIIETEVGLNYDYTQDPVVIIGRTFSYYGVKAGQTILVFYKNGITSTTGVNSSTLPILTDPKHPVVDALLFVVNVNDPNAQ